MGRGSNGQMQVKTYNRKWLRKLIGCAVIGLWYETPAFAQFTWNGGGSSPYNWSDPSNWGGIPITSSLTTTLTFDGVAGLTNTNDLASPFQLATLTFNVGAGAFNLQGTSATLQFSDGGGIVQNSNNNMTIAGTVQAAGNISITGSGTGTITVGNLNFANASGGTNSTGLNTGSAVLTLTGNITQDGTGSPGSTVLQGTINLGSTIHTFTGNNYTDAPLDDIIFQNVFQGTGGITYSGSNYIAIAGQSTYTGPTLFNSSGNNYIAVTNAIPPMSALTVSSGTTLYFGNFDGTTGIGTGYFDQNIGSLAGGGYIQMGTANLTTGNDNTNTTFSGTLDGSGNLTKVGTGTFTLTGTNTFTGAVIIANGTIAVSSLTDPGTSGPLGDADSTVSFTLGGTGTTGLLAYNGTSAYNYSRNFILAAGGSGGFAGSGALTISGTISGSGNLVYSGTGSTTLTAANTFTGNISVTSGGLIFSGATGTANASGNVSITGGGKLTLDNTAAAVQRLNNTTPPNLTLNSGEFAIIGNSTNLTGNTEVLGVLSVTGGSNSTNFLTLANTGNALQVTFSSLSITSGASILIRGDNLGGSSGSYTRVLFTTAPAASGNAIPGVFFDSNSTGTGIGQAAYSTTLGVILYSSPGTTGNVLDNVNSPNVPTTNSFATGGSGTTLTVNAGATVNDLKIQNEFTTVNFANLYPSQSANANAPSGTLVLTSGLFQDLNSAANVTVNGATGGSTLQSPTTLTVNLNTNVTFASNMTLSATGLTKTGNGTLIINGMDSITGNYTLSAGTVSIAGSLTAAVLTGNGSSLLTVGGSTSASSIVLNGTASAALTGSATFSGTINLAGTANTLTLTAGGSASSLTGATGNSLILGGNLSLSGTANTEYDGTISGTNGSITKTAASTGTLILTGTNTFGGALTINAGAVSANVGASVGVGALVLNGGTLNYTGSSDTLTSSSITLGSGGGTIDVTNTATTLTVNHTIAGAGGLTIASGVTTSAAGVVYLNLSSAATYSGTTNIQTGTLTLGASNLLPASTPLVLGAPSSTSGMNLNLNGFNQTVGSITIIAPSAYNSNVISIGSGTLKVNGPLSFVDSTGGTPGYQFTALISSTSSGILDLGGAIRNITVASQGNAPDPDLSLNVVLADGGINYTGNPSTFTSGPTILSLGGLSPNTYALGTTVNAGTINVASTTTLGTGGLLINQSGSVVSAVVLNNSLTVASLATGTVATSADAQVSINAAGAVLTVNQTTSTTFAGVISGSGGIAMTGSGTLTLTGTNTYTGTTTVSAGTLAIGSTGSLAAGSAVTVGPGTLAGTGTVSGSVTINSGGTLSGGIAGVGTLTLAGGAAISAGATIAARITNGSTPSSSPGGSTIGTIPNPTSNNFLNITSSSSSIDPGTLVYVNGTGTSFTPNLPYSYEIANISGMNLSSLNITTQSQFTVVGFLATNMSLTGDGSGDVFLNFTPVPEPMMVLLIGVIGLWLFGTFNRGQAFGVRKAPLPASL